MKAITKQEVNEAVKSRQFPDFVIQAFNECILESKIKGSNTVEQDDVITKIIAASGATRGQIFENHWLDVEDHYRAAGWVVTYDNPAYNDFYESHFTFK
jgi:hypothetical protein